MKRFGGAADEIVEALARYGGDQKNLVANKFGKLLTDFVGTGQVGLRHDGDFRTLAKLGAV